jgi:hypothetical protein
MTGRHKLALRHARAMKAAKARAEDERFRRLQVFDMLVGVGMHEAAFNFALEHGLSIQDIRG